MKKIIIFFSVLSCLMVITPGYSDLCYHSANRDSKKYLKENLDKQYDTSTISDETANREAKIRNLCFHASIQWHLFCDWARCRKYGDDDKIIYYRVGDVCRYKDIDCFGGDVNTAFNALQESQDASFGMFFVNMDDVTKSIRNNAENVGLVDTDKSVCYRTDSNGNTIWHAFAETNKNINSFAALCVSGLKEDGKEFLFRSVMEQPNVDGKSAANIAIDSGQPEHVFSFIASYAKEKGENCDMLENRLSESAGVDKNTAHDVLRGCR